MKIVLMNNLRLNEISVLTFFQFYCKINRNQSETVAEPIYGLYPNQCIEILNLKFRGRSLVTRHFRFHSNSRGADEIKDLPILIDFRIQKHGVITPVQYYISMLRLIGICRIQRCRSRFLFWAGNTFLSKTGPKNQNYQFKLGFPSQTNSNLKNSKVMLIFSAFDQKCTFFGEIPFKKSILFVEN